MNENSAKGDKFSPQASDVPEVTEVFEVAEAVNNDGFGGEVVAEEAVSFTPMAASAPTPSSFQASSPAAPAEQVYQQPTGGYPQTGAYPQADSYPQAPQSAYGQPQTTYPNPGQPFDNGQVQAGVYIEEVPWSDKSKLAAGLFGILLGTFGVHNFYLGFTGKAVAQLLITILSFGFLSWVSGIWGLVEGILVLSSQVGTQWDLDAKGLPMRPIGAAGA